MIESQFPAKNIFDIDLKTCSDYADLLRRLGELYQSSISRLIYSFKPVFDIHSMLFWQVQPTRLKKSIQNSMH